MLFGALAGLLCLPGVCAGQSFNQYQEFFDGPAKFLMTREEEQAWERIEEVSQAQLFFRMFWAKRDPDPSTQVNEFFADFKMRVDAADLMFSTPETKGSRTDRGMVLILIGKPQRRMLQKTDPGMTVRRRGARRIPLTLQEDGDFAALLGQESVSPDVGDHDSDQQTFEVWEFETDGDSEIASVVFVQAPNHGGDFFLERNNRLNAWVMLELEEAPQKTIANPDLGDSDQLARLRRN
jgi:GWxTD domain-containing protein